MLLWERNEPTWLATLTLKGQIAISKEVRGRLCLKSQDKVLLLVEEGGAVLVPLRRRTVEELAGSLSAKKPYLGVDAVRHQVGRALGEAAQQEDDRCQNEPM